MKRIRNMGGICIRGMFLMKRCTFDIPNSPRGTFVRIRDEGNRITLTYKNLTSLDIGGMKEIELIINDFEKARQLLQVIGLVQASYEENRREKYLLNNVEITVDEWPGIPRFVEVEGKTEADVLDVLKKLGISTEGAVYGTVDEVYRQFGIKIEGLTKITFENPPKPSK